MKPDPLYMARALKLAERGRYSTQPNPRVGCVIVKDGKIIGEGFHQVAGEAHAEINALKQAGSLARGAEIFVTLEPCSHHGRTPPCADALIKARPSRVVVAMTDPNPQVSGQGIKKLESQGISVRTGVCEAAAKQLNRGFIARMQKGRPFVTLKLASSLDGRIAMQSGESAWITSDAARKDVHRLRYENDLILTGINTVLADDPHMTVRLSDGDLPKTYYISGRLPYRAVLDSQKRLPGDAAILCPPGQTLQLVSEEENHDLRGENVIAFPALNERLDLNVILDYFAEQQINNILVEAGGTLAAEFIKSGLTDELVVYQSPDIMGSSAQAMINLPEILKMNEKIEFEYQEVRKIGRDLKLTLIPSKLN